MYTYQNFDQNQIALQSAVAVFTLGDKSGLFQKKITFYSKYSETGYQRGLRGNLG